MTKCEIDNHLYVFPVEISTGFVPLIIIPENN
jgi:hypothetical protein